PAPLRPRAQWQLQDWRDDSTGSATRTARWLAASGVGGCSRTQPTWITPTLLFERNCLSVRPFTYPEYEQEGVIGCESFRPCASSRARCHDHERKVAKCRAISLVGVRSSWRSAKFSEEFFERVS